MPDQRDDDDEPVVNGSLSKVRFLSLLYGKQRRMKNHYFRSSFVFFILLCRSLGLSFTLIDFSPHFED